MNHPALNQEKISPSRRLDNQARSVAIPRNQDRVELQIDGRLVHLTNLRKVFWAASGLTRLGDLWKPLLSNRGRVRLERFL